MKYKNAEEAALRLEELSQLEGTELGTAWSNLIYLRDYSYCFSREFNIELVKEIIKQAEDSHKDFEIIEEEISREPLKPRY